VPGDAGQGMLEPIHEQSPTWKADQWVAKRPAGKFALLSFTLGNIADMEHGSPYLRVVEQADAGRFEVAPGTVHISYLELGDGGDAPEIVALVFEATQHALEFLRVEV
jgi:hypothetical protein